MNWNVWTVNHNVIQVGNREASYQKPTYITGHYFLLFLHLNKTVEDMLNAEIVSRSQPRSLPHNMSMDYGGCINNLSIYHTFIVWILMVLGL